MSIPYALSKSITVYVFWFGRSRVFTSNVTYYATIAHMPYECVSSLFGMLLAR